MTPPRPAAEHAVESLRVLEARTVFASWAARKAPGRRRDLDAVGRLLPRLAARAAGSAASGAPAGILPTVVVTGSKGKGEVAARTAGWLTAAGVRTGLVTSPGIVSNRDRFALDGRVVGERDYRRWLGILAEELPGLDVAEDAYLAPTGLFSALGHALLADLGAEVVVHEAGMGGAHDEVSLFDPLAVALTTVLPEHLDAFGPTLADVAREKFGLVHSAAPVASVAQADEIQPLLERACTTHGAPLRLVPPMPFPEANREVAAAAARAALARLGRGRPADEDPEPFVLNRPGRGSWHTVPGTGGRALVDACIDPKGLSRAVEAVRAEAGEDPVVLWSVPATKDWAGMSAWLDARGLENALVLLDQDAAHHLDYAFPEDFLAARRTTSFSRLREALLSGAGLPSGNQPLLLAGTISFGTALLVLFGTEVEHLYRRR